MKLTFAWIAGRSTGRRAPGFTRRFLPVWCAGLFGVASLWMRAVPTSLLDRTPALREWPDAVVRLMLLVNPLILVTAMAAAGAALAHRVGLRSTLAGDPGARLDARGAVVVGLLVSAVTMAIEAVVADRLGAGWSQVRAQAHAAPWMPMLLLGMLYGGLAEEVLMRWGVMSLVVWCVMRLQPDPERRTPQASKAAAWTGITVAAAVFAVGHLPALAQSVELNLPIVARTLGLNLLAGLAYGWLFWRRSLETAMLAHATTHVGLAWGRWQATILHGAGGG